MSWVTKHPLLIGSLLVTVFCLPALLAGSNAVLTIHDHLDGDHVLRILASRPGRLFDNHAVIPEVMNGLPRSYFPSGLNVTMILYALLPPLAALLLNDLLVRLVAFAGMYLLLSEHVLQDASRRHWIPFGVALCFAIVPFYTAYGLSVAGQPLLLRSFLRLLGSRWRWHDFAVIALFAGWSYLVLSGWILLLGLGIVFVSRVAITHRISWPFLAGIVLLAIAFAVVEHSLVATFFGDGAEMSHRLERIVSPIRWTDAVGATIGLFFTTHYHTGAFPTELIVLATILAIATLSRHRGARSLMIGIIALHLMILLLRYFSPRLSDAWAILRVFQWDRIYVLLPMAWMVLFALALHGLPERRA